MNYLWLAEHGRTLSAEYTMRFGKIHACSSAIQHMEQYFHMIPVGILTEFAQAMPDDFKVRGDAVSAYRNYYSNDKRRFASWNKGTPAPQWWETMEE
tara:strand:- start:3669 stop:3959 length:291 start_codon:yes stop_codon:yes gene_type:complete